MCLYIFLLEIGTVERNRKPLGRVRVESVLRGEQCGMVEHFY